MKFLLWISLILCVEKTVAQHTDDAPFKYFGFQAGLNISNMNFNSGEPPPVAHISAAWKPGFSLGFLLSIPVANKMQLQPEFLYTLRNGVDNSLGIDYTFSYLSIPVLFNYQVVPWMALVAGPQLELLIEARSNINGQENSITHDVEERSIGITGGLEFSVIQSLSLSARYYQGLNHIGIGQRSDVKEFKYQVINIMAGIRF